MKISSWLNEGQIYTSVLKENILKDDFSKFRYFVEVVPTRNILYKELEVIEENDYACIVFSGPYEEIEKYYRIIIKWIDENGYKIIGDSIEKNIVDYDFSDSEEEYISEIQIPIKKL